MSLTKTVAEIAPGDHAYTVMDSDEQHWEVAAGYVSDGLARREKVVYFDGERTAAPLLRQLRELDVAVEDVLGSRQLVVMPPETMIGIWSGEVEQVRGQVRQSIERALAEGYQAVRLTDEPAAGGHRPGNRLGELDQMIHDVIDGQPVTMLCQYERRHWTPDDLDQLGGLHPVEVVAPALYDDGLLRITRNSPFGTRLSGEIDHSNRDTVRLMIEEELDRALRSGAGDGDIAIHLESLRFADVTSIAQLVRAADDFPRDHRLVLHGVRPPVRRLLDRCGAPLRARLAIP